MSDLINSSVKVLDNPETDNLFTHLVNELTIDTAAGGKKKINKVAMKDITGKTIMRYPGGGSSGGSATGDGE